MIGVVLSGGRNTRFPYLKGFIEAGGTTLIERNIELLRSAVGEVVISANEPQHYFRFGVSIIGDIVESGGPLAGIYSVLRCTRADRVLAVACDMPFIQPELLRYITSRSDSGVVVATFEGKPQPLPGLYAGSALGIMEEVLERGSRSLRELIEKADTVCLDEGGVRNIDPEGKSFSNINTVEDLSKVLEKA